MPQNPDRTRSNSEAAATLRPGPWFFCRQPPDAVAHPGTLTDSVPHWLPAVVPGTVAASLRAAGEWNLGQPLNADASDWWFRSIFDRPDIADGRHCHLIFDGLATLAEVWLNGRQILTSDNMFRGYQVDITHDLRPYNDLIIVFRSLTKWLSRNRPRPRWKTNLVEHQQLRWCRTSLLGRIPGWSPPVAPVGPWRDVRLHIGRPVQAEKDQPPGDLQMADLRLSSTMDGSIGCVKLSAQLQTNSHIKQATLRVGGAENAVDVRAAGDQWTLSGTARIADPPLWWPHTHGEQPLVACILSVTDDSGNVKSVPCGRVGFRSVVVNQENDGFSFEVNGLPIYCRGACWTVSDIATLDGSPESLAHDLRLAREAGMNMLRVGGTMIYESDTFYDLCDQLGILVWQDFMFANMDYPVDDPEFAAAIEAEVTYQLGRLSRHACVAVYCGNSEVEQQAAMLGVPRELWRNDWFAERLPALCHEHHPDTVYVPSTPSGGTLPFHTHTGVAHYYGVGAYLQSIENVRRADVKFTAECLGFSQVPEAETIKQAVGGGPVMLHHPRWKERVPRDTGAGWDFEDVRDHYLKQFFGVDPVRLRSFATDRYLRLSRVVAGEMMSQVFAEWRGGHSRNRGGLVWFFKDLWPGAGWGIVDSLGVPKAAYYYLKRSWQTLQIGITDEGLNGVHLHVSNETTTPFAGFVELLLLRDDHVVVARKETACELPPRSQHSIEGDGLLDGFFDVSYAYRFGPPSHDLAIATLYDRQHKVVSEAFHFVQPREPAFLGAAAVECDALPHGEGRYQVRLKADRFLRNISFDVPGFLPSDNYFHLVAGREKVVEMSALKGPAAKFKGFIEALNLRDPLRIVVKSP